MDDLSTLIEEIAYDLPMKLWKKALHNVPVYGGIECTEGGSKDHYLTSEKYLRVARQRWKDGADGIYLFNFFTTREYGKEAWEPPFDVLSKLGNQAPLKTQTILRKEDVLPLDECLAR